MNDEDNRQQRFRAVIDQVEDDDDAVGVAHLYGAGSAPSCLSSVCEVVAG